MNKIVKIISILMLVIMLATVAMPVFATDAGYSTVIKNIKDKAEDPTTNVDTTGMEEIAGKVLKLVRNVAVILAVILITVLGVKYMMGSVEEKAGYQKSFVPLIVGAVVVVAATQLATMLFSVFAK